jgi:hypothetical protein
MDNILNYINEAKKSVEWIAIEVTTADDYSHKKDKQKTSQRVVSYETYIELKNERRTKSGAEILSIDALSPATRDKDEAMSYLDAPKRTLRKSEVDKGNADYIVYVINCGKFGPTGKTKFDWNIWDNIAESNGADIYTNEFGTSFLYGAPGSLKVGDKLCCVDNDTLKKIAYYSIPSKVAHVFNVKSKDDFVEQYRKAFPDQCTRPSTQFGKKSDGLPWSSGRYKFGQIYSIKGVSE